MICTPICGKIGFHGNREWMLSADGSAAAVMVEAYNSISSKITTSSIILYTTTRFTLVANYCHHHHHSLRNEICLPLWILLNPFLFKEEMWVLPGRTFFQSRRSRIKEWLKVNWKECVLLPQTPRIFDIISTILFPFLALKKHYSCRDGVRCVYSAGSLADTRRWTKGSNILPWTTKCLSK